jgi:uncharacterized protein YhjY with autotransporter beta-barrel domain
MSMTAMSEQAKAQSRWKVGETLSVSYGASQHGGYGFSIQDARGAPLLNIAYKTQAESEQAEESIRQAIEGAVDIVSYSRV